MAHEPYLPEKYVKFSDRALRREYSRLRSIATKRLARMGASEYSDTQIYKLNVDRFRPLRELSKRELSYALADVTRFVSNPLSMLSVRRRRDKETLNRLKAAGYDLGGDTRQLRAFANFMEYTRIMESGHIVGSDVAAQLYRDMAGQGLSPEEIRGEFNAWLTQQAEERRQNIALSDMLNRILGK